MTAIEQAILGLCPTACVEDPPTRDEVRKAWQSLVEGQHEDDVEQEELARDFGPESMRDGECCTCCGLGRVVNFTGRYVECGDCDGWGTP